MVCLLHQFQFTPLKEQRKGASPQQQLWMPLKILCTLVKSLLIPLEEKVKGLLVALQPQM